MSEVPDVAGLVAELRSASRDYDEDAAETACKQLVNVVRTAPESLEDSDAKAALGALRRMRAFELMERLGDGFLAAGVKAPSVERLHAQAVIEGGRLDAAKAILAAMVESEPLDSKEGREARGLLGRTFKQMYIEMGDPTAPGAKEALADAIAAYHEVYTADPTETWHGINVVALVKRAERDGVEIESAPNADEMAAAILKHIDDLSLDGEATAWDAATASEAALALGDAEKAASWLASYVGDSGVDAFALAGSLRQLEEVWQLTLDGEWGQLLAVLRANMMDQADGQQIQVDKSTPDTATFERQSSGFEKTFGTVGGVTAKWWDLAMVRARAVARIEDKTGTGIGTAFLVKGSDLNPDWGDELIAITNAHVVSDPQQLKAIMPGDAVANFTMLDGQEPIPVVDLLYQSGPYELDVAALRLATTPADVVPMSLARGLPVNDGEQRLYVIGHPNVGDLVISIDDNKLLDRDDRLLHYRAPTEPGSSGSPVFNRQWDLIALHHKGNDQLERLNEHEGERWKANEGISFPAIRAACAALAAQLADGAARPAQDT